MSAHDRKLKDESAENERQLTPVASKLVRIFLDAELPIGKRAISERVRFSDVVKDVIQLFNCRANIR